MDLALTDKHRALQQEVQAFIRTHGHDSPKPGGDNMFGAIMARKCGHIH